MSLTTTTLSSAVSVTDTSIVPAALTGFAAGSKIRIDQETMLIGWGYVAGATPVPVIRGQEGSIAQAHVASANVTVGVSSDWATSQAPQTIVQYPIAGRARTLTSYSASGAITLPVAGSDAVAVLNGTSALAMTLANPGKELDGCILYIIGNGKSASTIDFDDTVGLGNAGSSYDTITMQNGGQECLTVMACNGAWVPIGPPITGTTTALAIAIA